MKKKDFERKMLKTRNSETSQKERLLTPFACSMVTSTDLKKTAENELVFTNRCFQSIFKVSVFCTLLGKMGKINI
ncbi:MAG: hypothetical protein ACLRSW_16115 [Christensenellaceae bacterium]